MHHKFNNDARTSVCQIYKTLSFFFLFLKINNGSFKVLTMPGDQKVVSSSPGLMMTHYQALKQHPAQSTPNLCV